MTALSVLGLLMVGFLFVVLLVAGVVCVGAVLQYRERERSRVSRETMDRLVRQRDHLTELEDLRYRPGGRR